MAYIIKIQTANLQHSPKLAGCVPRRFQRWTTIGNGGRNRTRMYVLYTSGFDRHLDFHNEWVVGRHSFAMFENKNATFYDNTLCAVNDDLLLLPVSSVILKMYNYRCLYSAQSFSESNIQNITSVKFIHRCYRRTMSVITTHNISIWPPKPEIITPLELWQTASKFQRQIRDFRWWRARYNISQMIATTIDYQKLALKTSILSFSGCWSLSQSLGDTLFGLAMVENPGLAFGISTVSVVVPVV